MSSDKSNPSLARALALSHDMLSAAEKGDLPFLASLDLERMELLKSFRSATKQVSAVEQALLAQINATNDRAIGLLEHQRRGKGCDRPPAHGRHIEIAALAAPLMLQQSNRTVVGRVNLRKQRLVSRGYLLCAAAKRL